MMTITLVGPLDCPICEKVEEGLEPLKEKYKLSIQKIDAYSPEGEELVMQYGILASPGVFIDESFVGAGHVSPKQLEAHIKSQVSEV